MKRVKLFNAKYSPNLGDGLLCECLEQALLESSSGDLSVESVDLAARTRFQKRGGGRSRLLRFIDALPVLVRVPLLRTVLMVYSRLVWRPHFRAAMGNCDAIVIGGGNLLTDVDMNFPVKISAVLALARERSLPVYFYGVSVGGSWSRAGRSLLLRALRESDIRYFSVRDAASKENLERQFGEAVRCDVTVVRDPGMLASRYLLPRYEDSRMTRLGINIMSALAVRHHSDREISDDELLRWYVNLIKTAHAESFDTVLFTNGSPEDVAFACSLLAALPEELRGAGVMIEPEVPADVVDVIATCRAVIAFRMHALITGVSLGSDIAALSWDPKVEHFMDSVGLERLVFDTSQTRPGEILAALAQTDSKAGPADELVDEAFNDVSDLSDHLRQV